MGITHIIFLLLMPDRCAENLKYMYRNIETGNTIIRKEIRQHKKDDIDNKFLHIWFLSVKIISHRHRIFYSLLMPWSKDLPVDCYSKRRD